MTQMTYDDMITTLKGFGGDATRQAIETMEKQRALLGTAAALMAMSSGLLKAASDCTQKPMSGAQSELLKAADEAMTAHFVDIGQHLDGKEPD